MRVLALEPYYGGSHRAFLDDWRAHSHHAWTVLELPPRKWKWRMRHAAVTFAAEVAARLADGARWDVIFCSDMLNVAEFRGLAAPAVRALPTVAYFHENQFTYPFRYQGERDLHFGFTNMTSALAADEVWFNSAFHRDDFLQALARGLKKMPDYRLPDAPERIRAKSRIERPGVRLLTPPESRAPGPPRILWAARWEHDKDPDTFFAALRALKAQGAIFRLSVLGEQYADVPPVFAAARTEFAAEIDHWGYQPSRADYETVLRAADIVVSTAQHEFFGIGIAEAISAGAFPLLPQRLAYPELLAGAAAAQRFFYDGSVNDLSRRLARCVEQAAAGALWGVDVAAARRVIASLAWPTRADELDEQLTKCQSRFPSEC